MTSALPALQPDPPPVPPEHVRDLADFRFRLRTFLSFSEQAAEAAGITAQHYQLLQILSLDEESAGLSITHIAQRMVLRHNSAVELVDRAERAGLVQRIQDDLDHRRALVVLTPRGRRLLTQLLTEHLRYLQQDGSAMLEALERVVQPERIVPPAHAVKPSAVEPSIVKPSIVKPSIEVR